MSRRRRALIAALLGLALVGAGVSGAAFVASSSNATNSLGAAADWVPPAVSAATISPTSSGTPTGTDGFLKQGGAYRIYASVDDTTSGVGTVTANLTNVSGSGADAVPLVAGSYTVGSTTYNYASAEQTASDPLSEGSENYLVTAGDNADNTTTSSAFTVAVDNTAPSVASIVRHDSSPTNASSVQFDVAFDEPVSGVDAGDFAVAAGGGVTGASITGVSGSGSSYAVTVDTGSGDGPIGMNLADDNSIVDRATNPLGGAGVGDGNFTGQAYAIDRTAPAVQSITRADSDPTNANTVHWTVTFDEPVSGVGEADFALVESGGVSGGSITGVSGSGTTYTVTADAGSGDGSLALKLNDDDSIQDGPSNPLGGSGTGNGDFTGEAYTIDRTAPTVQSISRADSDPTNATTLHWTISFSESVSGVDASDFATAESGGATGSSVTGVSGSGTTYTVTANRGTHDGSVGLNLADDDSIHDGASNPLGGAGTGNGDLTGQAYTIDTAEPVVQSIDRADSSPTNAGAVNWTVTFSKPVSGVDSTDFSLAAGSVTGASITDVSGSGTTYTVTASSGSGSGSLGLNLADDDSIVDSAGNRLSGTGTGNGDFTGQAYTVDRTAPSLTSLQMFDTDGNGKIDRVTATFDETLASSTDTGPWTLSNVPNGGTLASVSTSGSSATLNLNEGAGTADTSVGNFTVALAPSATGMRDGLGNQSSFAATAPSDHAAPIVTAITRANSNPTNGSTAQWTVNFSESVSGVNTTDFQLATAGVTGSPSVTSVTGSGASRTVTASTGSGSGTIGLNLVDDDSIVDGGSNPLNGTGAGNGNFTGEVYTVDKAPPTVVSIDRHSVSPTNVSSVQFDVTFSESVTGVDAGDFARVQAGGVSGSAISGVTGSGASYTVTVSTGSNSGTIGLNLVDDDSIVDGASNKLGGTGTGNGNFTGQVYTIDKTVPTVSSINRVDSNPTNGSTAHWTVTFSEAVTGVDASDFALAQSGGVSGAAITGVTGSGTTYTVTASSGSGDGSLGLNLVDDDSIADAVSNKLGGTGTGNGNFTGQAYTIDKTAPAATNLQLKNKSGGTAGRVESGDSVVATYSEALHVNSLCNAWSAGGDASNQSLSGNNDVTVTVNNNAGGGGTDTLTVSSGSCTLHFGTVDLGSSSYVASANVTFSGSGSNKSTINWDATNHTMTIVFGGQAGSGTTSTVASSVGKLTPDSAATDPAGNALTSTFSTATIQQF